MDYEYGYKGIVGGANSCAARKIIHDASYYFIDTIEKEIGEAKLPNAEITLLVHVRTEESK